MIGCGMMGGNRRGGRWLVDDDVWERRPSANRFDFIVNVDSSFPPVRSGGEETNDQYLSVYYEYL